MKALGLSRWRRRASLWIPPVIVAAVAFTLFFALQRERESIARVNETLERIARLDHLRARLADAEAGQRTYLITSDPADLEPYRGANRDVWTELAELRRAAPAGAEPRLDSLEWAVEERLQRLEAGIALRRSVDFESARALVTNGDGRPLMGVVRRQVKALQSEANTQLRTRQAHEERRSGQVLWLLFGGALVAVIATVGTHRLLSANGREIAARNQELREKNEELESQTIELEMQAEELQSQAAQLEETMAELEAANDELYLQRQHLEEMAAELEASNDELLAANGALEERTSEAEEANQAKSDFLATMSHELRTPLNAIAGYTELLEIGVHGPVNEAQHTALTRIQRNQKYLLALINDVLNFAKLEAGRIELRMADVPVAETLKGLEDLVRPQLLAREIAYSCEPADEELRMRGDRDRIEQILINLLTNAIKFTPEGGRVSVSTSADEEALRIRVADTGCGIPAERLQEIFDPFVQVYPDRTARQPGVGLGLAISRRLARSMGGDLVAKSVEGEGSTFTLTLLRGHRTVDGSIFSVAPVSTAPEPSGRPRVAAGD